MPVTTIASLWPSSMLVGVAAATGGSGAVCVSVDCAKAGLANAVVANSAATIPCLLVMSSSSNVVLFVDLRRSEEHTSELQSLMRITYAVFCLKKKKQRIMHATDN